MTSRCRGCSPLAQIVGPSTTQFAHSGHRSGHHQLHLRPPLPPHLGHVLRGGGVYTDPYDAVGNQQTMVSPEGSVNYTYDSTNRLTQRGIRNLDNPVCLQCGRSDGS
jgi:hypothetical protein